jgi:dynein heavy chain 1
MCSVFQINEFVHKRTVTRRLIASRISSPKAFEWLCEMRFYFDPHQTEVLQQLTIHMANAKFFYGFEYLGVQDRLVQTPLTDRCYLTMTQALEARLGGSPFGKSCAVRIRIRKVFGFEPFQA